MVNDNDSTLILRINRWLGVFGVSVVVLLAMLLVECGWIGGAVVQTRLCLEYDMDLLHHMHVQMLADQRIIHSQQQYQILAATQTIETSETEKITETDTLTQQLEWQEERIRQQQLQHVQETQEKEVMAKELATEVASLKRELESLEQMTVETTSHLERTVKQNESIHLQQQEQQKMQLESLQDERSHLKNVLGAYTTHLNQLSDTHHKLETTVQQVTQQVRYLLSTTTSSSSTSS
mmetsp:Transcript_1326/g.2376  ORF Transcript_1326/g.2376 Transcript_1326/m.2376 type:complete len:236 (-) Transcript_1326:75-782(-)